MAYDRAVTETLSAAQARRIAIAAQRLDRGRRGGVIDRGHIRRLLDDIGLLQIDSVNVVARAHYLPVFARLGAYPTEVLDGVAWPDRTPRRLLFETWAHAASLVPIGLEPFTRWRRKHPPSWLVGTSPIDDDVMAAVAETGPLTAGQIQLHLELPGRDGSGWWEWSGAKHAAEKLFASGRLAVAYRRGFQRFYDLPERVIPMEILHTPTPTVVDAKRHLVARAVAHHGVGTVRDIADYYRLPVADTRAALRELQDAGRVIPVTVDGWDQPAFLDPDARIPRRVSGRALLCPFDPLIWERDRTQRLFDLHYRIEIYTPAHRRRYGYYVFPLLVGDRIVGRFDLKADRAASSLIVKAAWLEPGADVSDSADHAATELAAMATWLGLESVTVERRGNLADVLRTRI